MNTRTLLLYYSNVWILTISHSSPVACRPLMYGLIFSNLNKRDAGAPSEHHGFVGSTAARERRACLFALATSFVARIEQS